MMYPTRRATLLLLLLTLVQFAFFASDLRAQFPFQPNWLQFYTQHASPKGFYFEADGGYRNDFFRTSLTMGFVRAGAGINWKRGFATTGVAWFESHDNFRTQPNLGDLRLYQKVVLRQELKPLNLTHVIRLEERWVQRADNRAFNFQLRFRYLLQGAHTFTQAQVLHANPYLIANTEILLVPTPRILNQYRLYGGAGLNWGKRWLLEMGYMRMVLATQPMGTLSGGILRTNVIYNW